MTSDSEEPPKKVGSESAYNELYSSMEFRSSAPAEQKTIIPD
jgi:hypothetical protein